jgi:hypothetical protein
MSEQLSFFEPTGPEVLAIAAKKEREAQRHLDLSDRLQLRCWYSSAYVEFHRAKAVFEEAQQMYMLAEFEALGGIQ